MELPTTSVDEILARAVVYRALSVAFRPPESGRLALTAAGSGLLTTVAALDHLAGCCRDESLANAAANLASLSQPARDAAETTYWRLFGHTTRGAVCACETEYGPDNAFHQPQQLADISGYYLAFGLRAGAAADVRADHIACECEFMDFLCRKEAVLSADAESEPAGETLEATRDAARTFLRDHLGRFGCALGARLAAEDPDGFHGALGLVLLAFLRAECGRVGVPSGAIDLAVRPEDVDETPMACGSGDDLIRIQGLRGHP
jgi:putative dimethyl sulfoxide reductase chaperone